ncbi:unnamed protein product [Somion occarium]|uniref:Uncharacterized protein n=1 Tax=Somion occarium TaxID=3059160 RepID=A0ABP1CEL0_9APHY
MHVTVLISSLLLAASVQAAPVRRDLGNDISRIMQDVQNVANDAASVAASVIAELPPPLASPASSLLNEVTAGAAAGFAEVTSILGEIVTLPPPTSTVIGSQFSTNSFPTSSTSTGRSFPSGLLAGPNPVLNGSPTVNHPPLLNGPRPAVLNPQQQIASPESTSAAFEIPGRPLQVVSLGNIFTSVPTQSPAFALPGRPLQVAAFSFDPLNSLNLGPTRTVDGSVSSATRTFTPSDLAALLNELLPGAGSSGSGSSASVSVSFGATSPSLISNSGAAAVFGSISLQSVPASSTPVSSQLLSSSATASGSASISSSSASASTSTSIATPVIGGISMTTIPAPAVTLPGQPLTSIATSASATGSVYPNVPSKRGLGSLIGIVGSELGPLIQDADNLGNKVASIGNKLIAALPSDIQAPASSFFAEATSEVGKGFSFVTSIAGPIVAASPTSTSSSSSASVTSSSSSATVAAQNAAAQPTQSSSASRSLLLSGLTIFGSLIVSVCVAL